MAALVADRQTDVRAGGGTRLNKALVAATKVIYVGQLIAKNATGFIVPAADIAAIKVLGIAQQAFDNTLGADGAGSITYLTGVEALLDNDGNVTQAQFGTLCTVKDDHTVSTAAITANDIVAGRVRSFTATTVWVYVDEEIGAS